MSESRLDCFDNGELFVLEEALVNLDTEYNRVFASAESEHNVILKNLREEFTSEFYRRNNNDGN